MFEKRFRKRLDKGDNNNQLEVQLSEVKSKLNAIIVTQGKVLAMLEAIKAQVERNKEVDESVKVLLAGLKSKLDELASRPTVDPAEVQALADELGANTDDLASAVSANTPAEG